MMRSKHVAAGLFVILGLVSALAYAQIRETRQSRETPDAKSAGPYRVTPWPPDTSTDVSYAEEVEEYLNRMAREGWRLHGDAVARKTRVLIFERAGER